VRGKEINVDIYAGYTSGQANENHAARAPHCDAIVR
jgi:hypothetical protein